MGPSHIFIWGSAADHNMMLCWPLSYVRALYVVNTFLCFCSIAAGTSSNIFANVVRTFGRWWWWCNCVKTIGALGGRQGGALAVSPGEREGDAGGTWSR